MPLQGGTDSISTSTPAWGSSSGLRRWGLQLAARGGKNAKKRAIVAVARRLAILLHRLWVTAEVYEPLYGIESQAA
jgi:transposase